MAGKPKYLSDICEIDGCSKPRKTGTPWCSTHRAHRYRWGHPTEKLVNLRAKDPAVLCELDGCNGVRRYGSKWCEKHAARIRRHGDPAAVRPNRDPNPRYLAAHKRIYRLRGPAAGQVCVDCAGPADQWSYDHADPAERTELVISKWPDTTHLVRFSIDPDHYQPRCYSCHATFDKRHDG